MNRVKNLRYWVMSLALLLAGCETLPPPLPPASPIDISLVQGTTAQAEWSEQHDSWFVFVRQGDKFDQIIEATDRTPDRKLAELIALLVEKRFKVVLHVLKAPKMPVPITENALVKGEFELTDVFQKRVAAEAERVRLANETAQRSFEADLKKHQEAVEKQQRDEAERIKHNQEPAVIRAAVAGVTPAAIAMLYGNPMLVNFNYVADKQVFAGVVKSSKGGFSHPMELTVPLNKAEQIKKQFTEGDLIPVVTFDTRTTALGTELVFVKLDLVEDLAKQLAKQTQDFQNCKSSGNYRWFIGLYPNSPLVTQAKQRIVELDAADERARIAKLSADQQAAAAAVSAQKAEREFLTLGNCEVGATVHHRERWNTTTSSGNILADALFNAATRESFVIHFEGVVEGFLGNKVKVTINDYQVQQTKGGGFFARKTYQGASLGIYADKYIGKVQFYPRSRCSN